MIFGSQYLVCLFAVSRDMKLNPQQAPLYVSITLYTSIVAIFIEQI